jgi:4-hydroxybenzoate polyprenyltransferase
LFEAAGAAENIGIRSRMAMKGSTEFSTWVALAFGAIAIAVCAVYSSSLWVLIPVGLIGGYVGYQAEKIARRYVERELARRRGR